MKRPFAGVSKLILGFTADFSTGFLVVVGNIAGKRTRDLDRSQ
jgi:hypothetical protein